jgi:hypothetical protein
MVLMFRRKNPNILPPDRYTKSHTSRRIVSAGMTVAGLVASAYSTYDTVQLSHMRDAERQAEIAHYLATVPGLLDQINIEVQNRQTEVDHMVVLIGAECIAPMLGTEKIPATLDEALKDSSCKRTPVRLVNADKFYRPAVQERDRMLYLRSLLIDDTDKTNDNIDLLRARANIASPSGTISFSGDPTQTVSLDSADPVYVHKIGDGYETMNVPISDGIFADLPWAQYAIALGALVWFVLEIADPIMEMLEDKKFKTSKTKLSNFERASDEEFAVAMDGLINGDRPNTDPDSPNTNL